LRSELVEGSAGPGERPGGLGIRREYQILDSPQLATWYCEQVETEHRPRGAGGGGDAEPTRVIALGPE
ncbi:MAG: hydantoinase B/oxoprolinase family protein, partial [Actinobacteria bacterium]|nr:hydantoinase B/oxoprolinase family protein [Actinomycetota bacterium]NIS28654.1 hydantoinase B/oxoprolinase family protein [Actinomycetota bacterium]NIU17697.1 hydantoinase B/oxoprolinase family protein [Actinomycetota bacterium]NIU64107.1 hydantoinase B/oxoprolinase family protein [Actinomycetota bacterium]NIW25910.1 hypothetical protein [Actinomycetota bacterium]